MSPATPTPLNVVPARLVAPTRPPDAKKKAGPSLARRTDRGGGGYRFQPFRGSPAPDRADWASSAECYTLHPLFRVIKSHWTDRSQVMPVVLPDDAACASGADLGVACARTCVASAAMCVKNAGVCLANSADH